MTIPDYISPIVASRVWHWDASGLKSLNQTPWLPGKAFAADCKAQACHDAPASKCTCGVYASKGFEHLQKTGLLQFGIYGEVYLWGTVVEHELGWRAQYAYPKNLMLPLDMVPLSMGAAESRLTTLSAYSCDIFVQGEGGTLPLWHSHSGYDADGLDLLIQRSHRWYARRRQQRRLRGGDRVAVLGRGIAIIKEVDGDQVHATLWNRNLLRIGRKQIVWNEQNMRWEAAVVRSGA